MHGRIELGVVVLKDSWSTVGHKVRHSVRVELRSGGLNGRRSIWVWLVRGQGQTGLVLPVAQELTTSLAGRHLVDVVEKPKSYGGPFCTACGRASVRARSGVGIPGVDFTSTVLSSNVDGLPRWGDVFSVDVRVVGWGER